MAKARVFMYQKAVFNALGGEAGGDTFQTDFLTDSIKVSAHTSTYTPNKDTHEVFSDVTNEVTDSGYSAGGVALTSKAFTFTAADSWGTQRANTTAYVVGDIYRPVAANGLVYQCIVAGTSAGSPPTFPTIFGKSFADNTAEFTCVGRGVQVINFAVLFSTVSITARYLVIRRDTGTASTSPLFWLVEFLLDDGTTPADVSPSAGNLSLTISGTLGFFQFFTP
jgi:hypothetical protein